MSQITCVLSLRHGPVTACGRRLFSCHPEQFEINAKPAAASGRESAFPFLGYRIHANGFANAVRVSSADPLTVQVTMAHAVSSQKGIAVGIQEKSNCMETM